jgi:uncharacterized repeat protein (TIGR01451 family)
LDNAKLQALVPNGAQTGPITVVAPAGTNTTTSLFALDYGSDLQVSMTSSPDPATVGRDLLYAITIVNNGPFDAPNTKLTNTLPASVKLLSASITNSGVLVTNNNPITGTLGTFTVGSAATLVLKVTPQLAGVIVDTISVSSDNPDPVPTNNAAGLTSIVEPVALLSIRLSTNQVQVSWPAALTNYVLEFQTAFNTNSFWSVITTPPTVSAGLSSITETNLGGGKFYRLRK